MVISSSFRIIVAQDVGREDDKIPVWWPNGDSKKAHMISMVAVFREEATLQEIV
jgi:hypothetical protein